MNTFVKTTAMRVLAFIALLLCATGVRAEENSSSRTPLVRNAKLEKIAMGLSAALEMRKPVQVVIVPENDRVVSVEPFLSGEGFRVEIEQAFYDQLTEEEVNAALAHEIGHVWIFCHQPYIHTEHLANEIALKVVRRQPLEALYAKLWAYLGITGNMDELLGAEK